ncbi:hypothetical protein ANN_15815 [Periplaneta americana]|uniref:Uncharacterized protein n=1 Tax=Periplaneta americana TaxID=6978 RepID=A0ABQ8SII1_PERAM|nr:hypothetical protein ANN_15815 [Periplaneta americana]
MKRYCLIDCDGWKEQNNCNDPAPVPAPRTKRKKKLASALTVTHFNSVSDETLPKVIPPRRKNKCKTSVELEIIIKDCCCKDNKTDIIGIVATDDSTSVTINDEAVDIIEISHTVEESKLTTNTHDIIKGNNMYIQLEEQGQDDSGVYLPEAMSSGNNLADFMQTGHHIDDVITSDALSSSIRNITLSNSVIPLLGELEEINIDNYTEAVNTELLNSGYLLQEEFSDSSNIPLVTTSSTSVNSSNVLIDNIEEAINDTVSRIYQILDYKEPQKTFYKEDENSFLGYPVYDSDDKGDVFHERDKDISVTASSNYNNVVQFLFPREPPPVHRTLQYIESSISLLMNPYHFDHMIEGNVVPPDLCFNSLSLLLSDDEPSNTLIRSIQLRMPETDGSVNSVCTASINSSEQCTTLLEEEELEEIPTTGEDWKVPTTGEDCCLYSALGNVEAFTNSNGRNQQLAAIENVNKLQIDCEEEEEDTKYSYKTYRRSEIHPKKISESFDLFLKHMLMDSEQYDLNYYQRDNTKGSINFECALNQTFHNVAGTQVTILTDKTNKGPSCLELNEEDIIHLPVDSMASPRCIIVESDIKAGVACDNINNKCGECSQYVRDSENANIHNENSCAVSVVSINTAVPSSNESCQSSFHTDHQDFSDSKHSSNITSPIGTSEDISKSFVNSVDHSSENYNLINSGNLIETVNEDSFITTNKRDKLPSESMDTINKLSDIFQQQNVINPQVPVVVKVQGKSLTKK